MLLRRKTRSRIQTAEKALRKGDLPTAIAAFEETVRRNPDDVKSRRQLADVYCKAGRFDDAVRELQALAGSYAANGLLLKAIAQCKAILDIDPEHTETQATLAKLYAKKRGGGLGGHMTTLPGAMARGVTAPPGGVTEVDIVDVEDADVEVTEAEIDDEEILEAEDVAEIVAVDIEATGARAREESAPPQAPPDEDEDEDEDEGEHNISAAELEIEAEGDEEESIDAGDLEEGVSLESPGIAPSGGDVDLSLDDDALAEVLAIDEQVEEIAHQLADMEDEDLDFNEIDSAVASIGGDEDEEHELTDLDADELIVGETMHEMELDSDELPEFPLFSELPLHALEQLISKLEVWRVPPGAIIVRHGEVGHSFFVVVSGSARVERNGEKLAVLGPGEFFGEMAILSKNPRTASVIAEEDCELFEIKRDLLDEISSQYKSVEQVLFKFCRQRLLRDVVRSSLFRGLEEEHVRAMIASFKTKRVNMGQRVIEQGKKSRGLYVILAGEVDVSREDDGAYVPLSQLKEGDVFGEMSLLGNEAASATVTTLKNTTLLALSRQGFRSFCEKHPTIKNRLEQLSEERRQENEGAAGRADSRMV